MTITINSHTFKYQKDLHRFVNGVRTIDSNEAFQIRANSLEVSSVLLAIMTTRPKKREELAGRKVVRWIRKKLGRNWAIHADLDDGNVLDLGVSKGNISEFTKYWQDQS